MDRKSFRPFLLLSIFLLGLTLPPLSVNATLLIMPIHLILGDRDRTGNITVFNTSGKEAVFRLAWRYQKQTETGAYIVAATPFDPDHDLSKFAVFSPRQVTLQAGQKQRVRISVRRPPDLAEGEYRAHLALVRMAEQTNEGPEPVDQPKIAAAPVQPAGKQSETKVTIGLGVNVSYSLPIVLRQGTYDTTASIAEAKLLPPDPASSNKNPQLFIALNRTGKYSVFGKIKVYWAAPGQEEKQIGITNNVNILPEITRREVKVYLTEPSISGGSLRIVYEGEAKEKGTILDQKTVPVGG